MANDDAITAVEVQETDYGEKVVIQSPFDAKEFINALPWKPLEEEIEEHGSLEAKLEDRDVDPAAIQAANEFDFSDEFAARQSWDPDALGGNGAWTLDKDAWGEAADFFEFSGFDVEVEPDVVL